MKQHIIPAREVRIQLRVANSHFIAAAAPAFTVEEARAFIDAIEAEFEDATHHVPAYIIGHGNSVITHCSDNGEPSGTAGPPVLAVLKGSGLGDVVTVVTRYFGGTKLGTGGLVRAYSRAARQALAALPRARKVPTHTARVVVPYALFEQAQRLVRLHGGQVVDKAFTADVTLTAQLPQEALGQLQAGLKQISRGSIEAEIIHSDPSTILPLQSE